MDYNHGDIVQLKDGRKVRILEIFYKGEKIRGYDVREIGTDPYTTSTEEIRPSQITHASKEMMRER